MRLRAAAILLFLAARAQQGTVPLRLIVVNSAAQADTLRGQLNAGADFAVLAREKSLDATSVDGGFLGTVDPASLRPELRDALQGLAPGAISKVFRLPSGFAILKMVPASELAGLADTEKTRRTALNAEGAVRFDFDISGINETEAALAGFPKPAGWYLDVRGACEVRKQSLEAVEQRALGLLDPANVAQRSPIDVMSMRVALGQVYAYRGEMAKAIDPWEMAFKTAERDLPRALPYLHELLGIGYLHKSEIENDVYRNPGERCLFPMPAAARYPKTADAQKAAEHFLKVLADRPGDIELKWLLNLAFMQLGKYPSEVPKDYLLAPAAFASSEDIGRFTDVAARAGIRLFSMAGGIIVDDFDGDNLFDIVTSSFDMCAPMHFFHNNGDGTFSDRSRESGLATQLGGLNIVQADYNNDGCLDILVMRGGWEVPQRRSLLRNNCNGTFTDVTKEAGLAEPAMSSQTAVWADINNDGLLDLFTGNENGPNQLLLNRGDGTFRDISHAAGVDLTAFSKAVIAEDYDNDGWMDLYINNYRGDNALYHNNHDGTFTDIARQAGVTGSGHGFPAWFFDYDNDGWPDLFVSSYYMSVEETMRSYLGLPHNGTTFKLYRNLGNGAFRDVTVETAMDKVFMPMGSNFGDVDNDGYLDMYLGTGDPTYTSEVPNVLLHNQGGKRFVDITASSGTGELHKGHGVAFADIDSDGDEDILTVTGGATPGDSHAFRLFENPGHGNDWISLRLKGTRANHAAIGARIKVTVRNEGSVPRSVYRTVSSGGSFGASPLEQHLGLGKAAQIVSVEIRWPGTTAWQSIPGLSKNQAFAITQGAPAKKIDRRRLVGQALATPRHYPASGIILKIDRPQRTFVASIAAIPGYMEAMAMPFRVLDERLLDHLEAGAAVDFTLVVEDSRSYAEGIRVHRYESLEQEPLRARRLQLLAGAPAAPALSVGEAVPDFTLTDQAGSPVSLSAYAGKVVALTFVYTSCPLPDYCFRLSNNFGLVSKRFVSRMGRDLVLMSISFDPVHDRPAVLAKYASTWKADPKSWHFLTGDLDQVKAVCRRFGLNFWQEEGALTHSLHTVVIGRNGKLAADFEGNEFTARQIGDFLEVELEKR